MQRHIFLLAFALPLTLLGQGTWIERTTIPSAFPRWGTCQFTIGGTGYVIGGRNDVSDMNEVWAYDAANDSWQAKAPVPGVRRLASAFSIGDKGYVTCGLYNTSDKYNDLWEYDPAADTWTQKATLPSAARYGASSFVLGGKGYLLCGNLGSATGPYTTELWEYDPIANSWTAKASLPDQARFADTAFSSAGMGYVYGGRLTDQTFSSGLWAYDPAADSWSTRAPLPATPRTYCFAWSLADRAILMGGSDLGLSDLQDCWSYNPLADAWSPLAQYTGDGIWAGGSMAIGERVFAGFGRLGTGQVSDHWELRDPFVGIDEADPGQGSWLVPNIIRSGEDVAIQLGDYFNGRELELELFNMEGRLVFNRPVVIVRDRIISVPELPTGNYLARLRIHSGVVATDRLIIIE